MVSSIIYVQYLKYEIFLYQQRHQWQLDTTYPDALAGKCVR